jgi:methionyl-tRNA synthetase
MARSRQYCERCGEEHDGDAIRCDDCGVEMCCNCATATEVQTETCATCRRTTVEAERRDELRARTSRVLPSMREWYERNVVQAVTE